MGRPQRETREREIEVGFTIDNRTQKTLMDFKGSSSSNNKITIKTRSIFIKVVRVPECRH